MRLKSYREELIFRLRNPRYAAAYLEEVLVTQDNAAFLIALRDVIEATGGMAAVAGQAKLKRPSLYKILSRKGNPTLATLRDILEPLGLRFAVTARKAA
jgi:probable addiction module antidote protein